MDNIPVVFQVFLLRQLKQKLTALLSLLSSFLQFCVIERKLFLLHHMKSNLVSFSVDSIAVSLFTNSEFVNRETAMLSN